MDLISEILSENKAKALAMLAAIAFGLAVIPLLLRITLGKTAAPAVCSSRRGFTLIEVLVVVIIIGILASLSYASLVDIIFANRAKETAQVMRSFAERSLAEAKRMNTVVTLTLVGGNMTADYEDSNLRHSQPLSDGFNVNTSESNPTGGPGRNFGAASGNNASGVTSQPRIGISGISEEGYFVACGARDYCGAAVKVATENSFKAYIKKGANAGWMPL